MFNPGHGFRQGGYSCVCKNGVELSSTDVEHAETWEIRHMCYMKENGGR